MVEIINFDDERLLKAIALCEVVAIPTETVYGLCTQATGEGFANLAKTKRRLPDKPFTLVPPSMNYLEDTIVIDEGTRRVIEEFVPGELTILARPKKHVEGYIHLESDFIGIRVPNKQEIIDLLTRLNLPLFLTSANISGGKTLTKFEDVYETFKDTIPYIVKEDVKENVPSTIVQIDKGEIKLIRQGSLDFEEIKKVYYGEN